jgi:hypothetical protein
MTPTGRIALFGGVGAILAIFVSYELPFGTETLGVLAAIGVVVGIGLWFTPQQEEEQQADPSQEIQSYLEKARKEQQYPPVVDKAQMQDSVEMVGQLHKIEAPTGYDYVEHRYSFPGVSGLMRKGKAPEAPRQQQTQQPEPEPIFENGVVVEGS